MLVLASGVRKQLSPWRCGVADLYNFTVLMRVSCAGGYPDLHVASYELMFSFTLSVDALVVGQAVFFSERGGTSRA